jgi:hypothetical protein
MSVYLGGAYGSRIGRLGHTQVRTIRPCLEAHHCRGGKRWQALYCCKRCTKCVCSRVHLYSCRPSDFSSRILRLTNPPVEVQDLYKHTIQEFAKRGFRTLGKLFLRFTSVSTALRPARCGLQGRGRRLEVSWPSPNVILLSLLRFPWLTNLQVRPSSFRHSPNDRRGWRSRSAR